MQAKPILTLEPRVIAIREVSAGAYVLRIERGDISFLPGQNVSLGLARLRINREYSIYSDVQEPWFDFLIRDIQGGALSPALRTCRPGDTLEMCGPYGSFILEHPGDTQRPILFIATGTGIAPYRSMIRSYPGLNYRILHGVRRGDECYDAGEYPADRYIPCLSGADAGAAFRGRVTDWLRANRIAPETLCYVCGNNRMIADVYDLLRGQGHPADNLVTEAFF